LRGALLLGHEEERLLLDALGLAGGHAGGGALLLLGNEEESLLLLALGSARGHARLDTLLWALVAAHLIREGSASTARVLLLELAAVAVVVRDLASALVLEHIGAVALLYLEYELVAVAVVVVVVDGRGEVRKLTARVRVLNEVVHLREAALTLGTREFASIGRRNLLTLLALLLLFLL
ncbi:hypothetical protein PENTCL1PPCAC_2707, partial [Pristionchus entomophagus]